MKIIFSLIFILNVALSNDCFIKPLNSCRDGYTKNLSKSQIRKAQRSKENSIYNSIFNSFTSKTTHQDFINSFLKIEKINKQYNRCKLNPDNSDKYCLRLSLQKIIYYGYSRKYLDATATMILLSKFTYKKGKYSGGLDSYASKIHLLQKSYTKNQKDTTNYSLSPLSDKKYLKSFGKLKKLTPRQSTLLRYNYSQIKFMGKIMQDFEQRVLAINSGVFFDFDGDGKQDETYIFDEAEKYRLSVKLLKLELEKKSHTGEVFEGNKPDFHDLLVASSELGLINNEALAQMIEMPYLYEQKVSPWIKVGNITWEIGKSIAMAMPGINLFAIIPIVLVESIKSSKDKKNETSDLHIITF
ncbi:MAG: hypothetical protein N4A33_07670 [Bacteriovoracaceae bacterium]|jgi:hypothetical protein|nr:hypothetical protein [Bacteriovoracaceae bacterium]